VIIPIFKNYLKKIVNIDLFSWFNNFRKDHGQYIQFPLISKEFNNWVDNAKDLWKLVEKMNFTFKS